jgi:hypothetical protein
LSKSVLLAGSILSVARLVITSLSLLSPVVLAGLAGQYIIQASFQVIALIMVTKEDWAFQPHVKGTTHIFGDKNAVCLLSFILDSKSPP